MKNSLGVHRICVNPHQPKISYHTPISVVLPSSLRTCLRVSTLFMSAKDSLMLLESKYNRAAKRTSNTKKHTHSLTQTHKHYTQQPQNKNKKEKIRTKRQSEKKNKSISRIKQVILQPISVSFQLPAVLALVFLFSPSAMSIYVLRTRTFTVYIHILYIW